jgi:hypothetical protein
MDPNETLRVLRDESEDVSVRIEAGEALDRWVANGGFMPHTTGYKVGGNTAAKLMLREEILRTTERLKVVA